MHKETIGTVTEFVPLVSQPVKEPPMPKLALTSISGRENSEMKKDSAMTEEDYDEYD
jgi:hypothetical protein